MLRSFAGIRDGPQKLEPDFPKQNSDEKYEQKSEELELDVAPLLR